MKTTHSSLIMSLKRKRLWPISWHLLSMEYGPSREADYLSFSQEILRFYETRVFISVFTASHCRFYPKPDEWSAYTHTSSYIQPEILYLLSAVMETEWYKVYYHNHLYRWIASHSLNRIIYLNIIIYCETDIISVYLTYLVHVCSLLLFIFTLIINSHLRPGLQFYQKLGILALLNNIYFCGLVKQINKIILNKLI
jgi:hypothetical protein